MKARTLLFITCSLMLVACDGWEFFGDTEGLEPDEAFRLSILTSQTCALPAHLDPKQVTILSYKVRLKAQHAGGVPSNYFYASLLTSDGERYLASFTGCEPVLSGPPLRPGEVSEGFLNFPIPPAKVPETLVYAPQLIGMNESQSTFELSLSSREKTTDDPMQVEE